MAMSNLADNISAALGRIEGYYGGVLPWLVRLYDRELYRHKRRDSFQSVAVGFPVSDRILYVRYHVCHKKYPIDAISGNDTSRFCGELQSFGLRADLVGNFLRYRATCYSRCHRQIRASKAQERKNVIIVFNGCV